MTTIDVTASRNYQVIIGQDLLHDVGTYAASVTSGQKLAIISDTNVWPLYGRPVQDSLTKAGFQVVCYTFPAGEASKNGQTFLSILNFLAENHLTRADTLIALGGGVVGDITGFAAATYLRGIRYIQLPTTLLAMVDSSVGGKTAIDLPAGKNLAGAFCQPNLVLCDTNALRTLPQEVFADGCAEVIKYGVLFDPDLFCHLEKHGLCFDKDYVVSRCVELKRDVVRQDEFDLGLRQKLNLGHTIGHSLERLNNFALSHGQAVAIGMAIVSRAAAAMGLCTRDDTVRILKILPQFSLPISTDLPAEKIYECALSDKKRAGSTINLILPEIIGNCIIKSMPIEQLLTFIEEGL